MVGANAQGAATEEDAAPERVLIEAAAPEYPRGAQRRGVEGHVLVGYTITPDGRLADIEVLESEPAGLFDSAVLRALEDWRYAPAAEPVADQRRFDFALVD